MSDECWLRHDAQLVGVSHPDRIIELVVIPYDTEATVAWAGRMVSERIARGAFDGIDRRPNRIRLNRDHDVQRTCGKAVALHTGRKEGLVAEVRVARTPLGDETLELADEHCLDASAGFAPMEGGMRWDGRDAYTVTRAHLDHIAMTPRPAYPDAKVLAVRHATKYAVLPDGPPLRAGSETSNMEIWRSWCIEDRLERLVRSAKL